MNWVSTAERLPLTEPGRIRCLAGWKIELPQTPEGSHFTWRMATFTQFCEGDGASWAIWDEENTTIEVGDPKAPTHWLLVPTLDNPQSP